jgi:D-sedoheptulose 7-phosphate isomerase
MTPEYTFSNYARRLTALLENNDWSELSRLADTLQEAWKNGRQVFLCGNGGSAANASHLANDFFYGTARTTGGGMRAQSLSANSAITTCLANDIGYNTIFADQLAVFGQPGDVLIALSGSGNSPNIVAALDMARVRGMLSCAILGYNGGRSKALADIAIHFAIDDMQIAEDMQLIVGHMLMQWLHARRAETFPEQRLT